MSARVLNLAEYFQDELDQLREQASRFAEDYPRLAQGLSFSGGRSSDPHVEMLIQSCAYLTGRLRYQLDADQALIPNSLLDHLYPHLAAPLPCMTVAQVQVKTAGANFLNGWTLERGRHVSTEFQRQSGQSLKCRLRTCYDTPLWPLEVSAIRWTATRSGRQSVLRVTVRSLAASAGADARADAARGGDPIQDLPLERLRFHLHGTDRTVHGLYDLLVLHLDGVAVKVGDGAPRTLPPGCLRWVGFDDDESVLPVTPSGHPAYRLLQEYFAFPAKFLFFDVCGLDLSGAEDEFELLFMLDTVADAADPRRTIRLSPDLLRLNCVPLVNLFTQPMDPLRLDHRNHEYRLVADRERHAYCEIYAIEELMAYRPDAPPRTVAPYFAPWDQGGGGSDGYFYAARRTESPFKSVPGTELYVSFMDSGFDVQVPPDETIGGRVLATNRRLPERLSAGDRLALEGPGPVRAVELLHKPTPHKPPALLGAQPWSLVSQLSLNHLSLAGNDDALQALRAILRLHIGPVSPVNWKQIASVQAVRCRPSVRRMRTPHGAAHCRGIHVYVSVDEDTFEGGSIVLFGDVLRRFFALYASVNTFTELTLESKQREGVIRSASIRGTSTTSMETETSWPPLVGAQVLL